MATCNHIPNPLPAYAWPGGYPIMYLTEPENCELCPACAEREEGEVTHYIHYEGPPAYCENCSSFTDSAYGDPADDQ